MEEKMIIPQHVAIIMDGNRRWAKERGLPTIEGHRKVADEILEPLIEHAANRGVKYITLWAWSTENWNRSNNEVSAIMKLFKHIIQNRWGRLHEKGVKIKVIGDISKFSPDIKDALTKVIEQTKNNTRITAIFALNYGGRDEMIRAIKKIKNSIEMTVEIFSNKLDTAGIPDPELIIRTGGEQRLSGFLLWQSEYSELAFPTWYMPEFTPEKLDGLIEEFNSRQRRFGK
jgi:undecaprenyl diphosphate synthase